MRSVWGDKRRNPASGLKPANQPSPGNGKARSGEIINETYASLLPTSERESNAPAKVDVSAPGNIANMAGGNGNCRDKRHPITYSPYSANNGTRDHLNSGPIYRALNGSRLSRFACLKRNR